MKQLTLSSGQRAVCSFLFGLGMVIMTLKYISIDGAAVDDYADYPYICFLLTAMCFVTPRHDRKQGYGLHAFITFSMMLICKHLDSMEILHMAGIKNELLQYVIWYVFITVLLLLSDRLAPMHHEISIDGNKTPVSTKE